jgi:hypothetical protein
VVKSVAEQYGSNENQVKQSASGQCEDHHDGTILGTVLLVGGRVKSNRKKITARGPWVWLVGSASAIVRRRMTCGSGQVLVFVYRLYGSIVRGAGIVRRVVR